MFFRLCRDIFNVSASRRLSQKHRSIMEDGAQTQPLFSFGVVADIQYADVDDGYNYSRTSKRHYRSSLQLLARARESWSEAAVKPDFVLQLGDIVDGVNKRHGASQRALDTVLREFGSSPELVVHHVWGNHEFYNFSRSSLLLSKLNTRPLSGDPAAACCSDSDCYAYHFSPVPGFRFVVLDAYDVSVLGREKDSEEYKRAMSLILQHNDNEDLNCPPAHGKQRFTMFNGGFSTKQLDWLQSVLTSADDKQERVTLISHLPVHPFSADAMCLAWNFDELLAVIRSHCCVVCFMAGHDHDGGYCRDEHTGVHHLTMEGVIETPPDSDAHATVSVYKDRMVLKGSGRVEDRVFPFPQ